MQEQDKSSEEIRPFGFDYQKSIEEYKKSDFFQEDLNTFSKHSIHFIEYIDLQDPLEELEAVQKFRIYDINQNKEYNIKTHPEELINLFQKLSSCQTMKNLWKCYWKQVERNTELFWDYCEIGDLDNLNKLLATQMINFNATWSRDNYNAVHYACIHGFKDVLERLQQVGCQTDAVTSFGRTALHLASIRGSLECVEFIIDNKLCDLNSLDQSRSTALHYASENNHYQVVKLLLHANIDASIKNDSGLTAEDLVYGIHTFTIFQSYNSSINSISSEETRYYSKYSIGGSVVRSGRSDQVMRLLQQSPHHKKQRSCLFQSCFMQDQDVISKDDFTLIRQLGTGGFGEVNLVRYSKNNQFYALKIMRKDTIIKRIAERYIIQERQTLEKVKGHPFMCQLHFAFQDISLLYLVLEYIQGEDMSKLLFREDRLKESVAKKYIAELVLAIEYLHKKGIIYRDLKPENVLIDIDGHIKLVDFGLVKIGIHGRKKTKSFCGTAAYLSPEMIQQKGHSFGVDWYGVGILTLELLVGENPFQGYDPQKVFSNVQNKRLQKPQKLSNESWDFIQQLMCKDPKYRLGANDSNEVKNHPWFKDMNWEDVLNKKVFTLLNIHYQINRKLEMPKYEWMQENFLQNIQKQMGKSSSNRQRQNQPEFDDFEFEEMEIQQSSATVQTDSQQSMIQDPTLLPYFYNWSFF